MRVTYASTSNCIVVFDVVLCYKRVGDVLDWETLQDLFVALRRIDDRVRSWISVINKILSK